MIEKPVDGVFAGKGFTFGAFEQAKPILLVKEQNKNEHEQVGASIAELFFEV
ncbi:hypothetical protein GCM10010912_57630 [Paenibacillus albidus]|uniref:Uncharacterized protein n=1 Tax=Paenibacillus albidus TaxID=2041023 RepID=A0A917D1K9_9BACL|nr:hypothetical protein [Paenibacillus albidus]GGG05420.1 hypothetical protein GCM10010912_57630 [Paenibacillus albidus]